MVTVIKEFAILLGGWTLFFAGASVPLFVIVFLGRILDWISYQVIRREEKEKA